MKNHDGDPLPFDSTGTAPPVSSNTRRGRASGGVSRSDNYLFYAMSDSAGLATFALERFSGTFKPSVKTPLLLTSR